MILGRKYEAKGEEKNLRKEKKNHYGKGGKGLSFS